MSALSRRRFLWLCAITLASRLCPIPVRRPEQGAPLAGPPARAGLYREKIRQVPDALLRSPSLPFL